MTDYLATLKATLAAEKQTSVSFVSDAPWRVLKTEGGGGAGYRRT
jgi:hypothetical protein